MEEPRSVILFDLGRTLIYPRRAWPPIIRRAETAMQKALHAAGIDLRVASHYGRHPSLLNLYYERREADLLEPTTANLLQELLERQGYARPPQEVIRAAMRAMYTVTQANWHPERDALPTLRTLKQAGYRMGLVSNAADDQDVQHLVDKGGFRPYFECVITSAALGFRKPHPRIFQIALEELGGRPTQAVMVGDDLIADIQGAKQLGLHTVWINRRVARPKQYLGRPGRAFRPPVLPDATITRLSELPALLADP